MQENIAKELVDGHKEAEAKEEKSKFRTLPPLPLYFSLALTVLGVLVGIIYLFHIGIAFWGQYIVGTAYYHLVLALFLPQVFLFSPMTQKAPRNRLPWYDAVLAALAFIVPLYYVGYSETILSEAWEAIPPQTAFILGLFLWAVVLEAGRRAVGLAFFIIVLLFSLYPLFAGHLPGLLNAPSFGLERVVGYNIMGPEGIIGVAIRILGGLFVGFILFGTVLTATGAASFFINVALSLIGTVRGGTAKVAVVGSAFLGTISGSVITNVVTTGAVTIPAMKKSGYKDYYAAAIETCASTGGTIMPPIMGAAAFVMAGFLNIPYYEVALAAAFPSILYFLCLYVQVDGYAAKNGLKGLPRDQLPGFIQSIKEGWMFVFSLGVLIYALFFLGREAQAPFLAMIPLFIIASFKKESRFTAKSFIKLLESVGKILGEMTAIMAAIGLLTGSLLLTGTAQSLSTMLIDFAEGNVILLVITGSIASFILGMGMTATACYLLLAVLLAPALVNFGLDPIAVHFFLFYCGVLSFITPPVAIGAYAASAIAGSNPMKTGFQASRLGAVLFILPIFIIFKPTLILHGGIVEICLDLSTATLGVIFLSSVIEGYLLYVGRLKSVSRFLTLIAGVMLVWPSLITSLIGVCLAAALFGWRKWGMRPSAHTG